MRVGRFGRGIERILPGRFGSYAGNAVGRTPGQLITNPRRSRGKSASFRSSQTKKPPALLDRGGHPLQTIASPFCLKRLTEGQENLDRRTVQSLHLFHPHGHLAPGIHRGTGQGVKLSRFKDVHDPLKYQVTTSWFPVQPYAHGATALSWRYTLVHLPQTIESIFSKSSRVKQEKDELPWLAGEGIGEPHRGEDFPAPKAGIP